MPTTDPAGSLPVTAHATRPLLARSLLAEYLGTGLLVAVVIGSGIAAQCLSPDDVGLQLLENSTATVLGLAVLILMLGPVSGAHFNPVVTLAERVLSSRDSDDGGAVVVLALVFAQRIAQMRGG